MPLIPSRILQVNEVLSSALVDDGSVWMVNSWLQGAFEGQTDTAVMGARYLTAADGELYLLNRDRTVIRDAVGPDFFPRAVSAGELPAATRKVDIIQRMRRYVGGNNDGYIDQMRSFLFTDAS